MSDEDKKARPRPADSGKPQPARKDVEPAADDGAKEIVAMAADAAQAGLATMPRSAGPLTAEAATIREADITPEAKEAGPVFGDFLKSVGFAVAETQEKLDETFRKTAEALSKQEINVIAVFEQKINNDGEMTKGECHVQQLPLINYVMPTIQEISRCEISADMKVSEFSSGNAFQIQGKSTSVSAGVSGSYGMFGGSVSGHFGASHNSYDVNGGSNYAQDSSVGSMHLEATIQPRENVQLPKPFIVQKGPSLTLGVVKTEPLYRTEKAAKEGEADKQVVNGRRVIISAELRDEKGEALPNKELRVSVDQPTVLRDLPAGPKTGTLQNGDQPNPNAGKITIVLTRQANGTEEYKPVEATVRAFMGLVSETIVVAI